MKRNILIAALLMMVPFNLMAQDDDMYFVPRKKTKVTTGIQVSEVRTSDVFNNVEGQDVDPDYHIGALRNTDDYNRRGHQGRKYGEVYMVGDTVYITEEELMAEDSLQQTMQQIDEEEDYGYASRLVRFHGGVRSPYYWDYYYDWGYDPFYYDSWYYGYGPYGWYGPYGRYGWYSPYYAHSYYGWYDPWYDYAWGFGYGGHYGGFHHGHYDNVHRGHGNGFSYNDLASFSGRGGRSEASLTGGRRSYTGVSASRGMGASAGRGGSSTAVAGSGSRSNGLGVRDGGVSAMRDGINSNMRRDGMSSRGTRTFETTTRTTQPYTQGQQVNTRTNTNRGTSSNRATRTETTTTRSNTYTDTSTRSYTPTTSSSSSSRGGNGFGGGSSSSRGGGGGFSGGGGSRGGGSSRGGR